MWPLLFASIEALNTRVTLSRFNSIDEIGVICFICFIETRMRLESDTTLHNTCQSVPTSLGHANVILGNEVLIETHHANLHIVQGRLVRVVGFGQRRNSNTLVKGVRQFLRKTGTNVSEKILFTFFIPFQIQFTILLRIIKRYGFNTASPIQRTAGNIWFIQKISKFLEKKFNEEKQPHALLLTK